MDEKDLGENQIISAIKEQISRTFQNGYDEVPVPDIGLLAERVARGEHISQDKVKIAVVEAEKIVSSPWFKDVYSKDSDLKKFFDNFKSLKG